MRGRHVPIRTCLGCGERAARPELVRVSRDASGALRPDPDGRALGRGGYLHVRRICWTEFARRKGMVRSLRAAVDRAARATLVSELTALSGERG